MSDPKAAGQIKDVQWLRSNIDNEDAVLEFLDNPTNMLEDQPTDVLIELAQKLKERRTKHYDDMIRIQEEQDRKALAEQEASKRVVEQKELELREDMRKAMNQADAAEKAAENPGSYALD